MNNNSISLSTIPSSVYLWTATIIFASSSAITRKITEIGAQHLVNGRNPISLCNVLFAGNLCALAMMVLVFRRQWNRQNLRQLSRQDWFILAIIAVLSGALGPGLIFAALDNTNVTNVVLIGRLEPPLALLFGFLFLRTRINLWTVSGSIVAFLGVAVTAFLASTDQMVPVMGGLLHIGRGELQAATAAVVLAIATVLSKSHLSKIPLGVFNIVRVAVGTVVFFALAKALYGTGHFAEILSLVLWQWIVLYAAVIVVMGQLCWFAGLRRSTPAEITLASSFNPIAAVMLAYLILGEIPTAEQYMGGAIILVGILLSLVGNLREIHSNSQPKLTPACQMEMGVGFRGI